MPYLEFKDKNNGEIFLKVAFGISFFAFIAGNVNTTLMTEAAITVSHVTGNLSHLGSFLTSFSFVEASKIFFVILFFFLGTLVSGFLLVKQSFSTKRRYGLITLLEGLLLLLAGNLARSHLLWSVYLCSLSMGLQNAMVSSYKGMVIRTTHMTGIITDLGFLVGSFLRKGHGAKIKIMFFTNILLFFLIGCCCGYFFTKKYGLGNLYINGFLLVMAGLVYYFKLA